MSGAWITSEDLMDIHMIVAEMFARSSDPLDATGPREEGLPDATVSRATATFDGRDLFPTDREKAAVLIHGINASHVFRDGNKRTSVAALAVVLYRNDWMLDCSDDTLVTFVLAIARPSRPYDGPTESAVREIVRWIRANTQKLGGRHGDMRIEEFLRCCDAVGGSYKLADTSWVVWGLDKQRSVRISRATKVLAEGVVKAYLSRIGLSEVWTGVGLDEFVYGRPEEQHLIQRYRNVLDRLAEFDRGAAATSD